MRDEIGSVFLQSLNANTDEYSGTTNAERDEWWRDFWQLVDQDPELSRAIRRWQRAGCDVGNIAVAMHRYVAYPNKLNEQRKERGKRARKILNAGVRALRDLESVHRAYGQNAEADRIAEEATRTEALLSRAKSAFSTKHLGTSRSWTDLAMIEGLVFEATGARPTPREIVNLIRAGRRAAGQEPNLWETNADLIRKGLENFKKTNNLFYSRVWTNPSKLASN
jgi:hypothetical protein